MCLDPDTAGYSISYNDFLTSLNLSRLLEESDHTPICVVPYAVPPARESLIAEGIDLKRNAIVVQCALFGNLQMTTPIFHWGVGSQGERHIQKMSSNLFEIQRIWDAWPNIQDQQVTGSWKHSYRMVIKPRCNLKVISFVVQVDPQISQIIS